MVSIWPFKGDQTSAATFEKTLQSVSTKISKTQAKDSSLRSRLRRYKALWTLYTSFVYIIYTVILILVTGYQNWGPPEYGAIAGGPVIIYTVRTLLSAYYNYRISTNQARLNALQKQKHEAVTKFKQATKYDSTQQLLEKYGAEPKSDSKFVEGEKEQDSKKSRSRKSTGPQAQQAPQQRTNLPPPPTANIQRPGRVAQHAPLPPDQQPQQPPTPQLAPISPQSPISPLSVQSRRDSTSDFAPNAEETPPQYAAASGGGPKWYDRLMDVLLGEDETKPINRIVLICSRCKLVNGQAPPGVKRMEELGKWKCMGCRAWNGEENDLKKIVEEVKEDVPLKSKEEAESGADTTEARLAEAEAEVVEEEDKEDEAPPARVTRSKNKNTKNEAG